MDIPDFVFDAFDPDHGGPLCFRCHRRLRSGQRPPWQPDAIGRAARDLASTGWSSLDGQTLPDSVISIIAQFLEPHDKP